MVDTKFIESYFSIPKVTLTVTGSDSNDLVQVIRTRKHSNYFSQFQICAGGLSAEFVQRTFDMQLFLCLHSFTVEDKIQKWGPDFAFLATSQGTNIPESTKSD